MADEDLAHPATDGVTDTAAPATDGGKSEIAGEIKSALSKTENLTTAEKSDTGQIRRAIEAELAKATAPKAASEAKPVGERARGPDGKFVPTAQETVDAAAADPQTPPTAAEPTTAPPPAWSKAVQAHWASLPPEVQAEITKREADVAKGFEKYQGLRAHEPVLDFANQIAPKAGLTGPQLVHQWAQVQEALLDPNRKRLAIEHLVKAYGVDLGTGTQAALAQQQPATPTAPPVSQADPNTWVDPEVAALKQQIADLTGWKTDQEQRAQQWAQQQAAQVQTAKMSAIDQFASEKGTDGQPLRPHLETVMPQMARLIADIRNANPQISDQDALQQAYDNAVWGNPTTRESVMQATKIAEEAERTRVARQRAQAASRGAVSPAGSSPQGPPATSAPKGTIRDQIAANLHALTA